MHTTSSSDRPATDRRSFLRTGALLAAPVIAIAAPAAALAAGESAGKLARLEDERAIEALHRKFLRHLNGAGDAGALLAASHAVELGAGLRAISEDVRQEAKLVLAADGLSATSRCPCCIERETDLTGQTTLERMARFQGQGSHRHAEHRVLATQFLKTVDGWRITGASLA